MSESRTQWFIEGLHSKKIYLHICSNFKHKIYVLYKVDKYFPYDQGEMRNGWACIAPPIITQNSLFIRYHRIVILCHCMRICSIRPCYERIMAKSNPLSNSKELLNCSANRYCFSNSTLICHYLKSNQSDFNTCV